MSLIRERIVLKDLLRALLVEKGIGDATMTSIVDRMSEYEAAKKEYQAWATEQEKHQRAVELAKKWGIDSSNAAKMLKLRRNNPEHDYDPKLLKKEKQVKDRLVAAHKAARPEYNTDVGDLPFSVDAEAEPEIERQSKGRLPPNEKEVFLSPSEMRPLQTYKWSDFVYINLPPIGGFDDDVGPKGSHPGEERLAKIFGAERQGDNVPFDLVDKDGKKWEVKGLLRPTSVLRPGMVGAHAVRVPIDRMIKVIVEIEAFVDAIEAGNPINVCDTNEQMRRYVALAKFIKREKKDIERKEISSSRFEAITLALENVAALRKSWSYESIKTLTGKLTHGEKDLEIPRLKLIKMLRMLASSDDDDGTAAELLATYGPRELALAELETKAAYDSPWDWMNAWDASIDVDNVFAEVDGLMIVTPEGFIMVPRSLFRDVLELKTLNQDRPRYAFVPGNQSKEKTTD